MLTEKKSVAIVTGKFLFIAGKMLWTWFVI